MSHAPNSQPPVQPLPRIGSYRLMEPLGSGGMSSVFRAVHEVTGHEVAVKILPRTLAKNATMLQRFLREARSAESLEHPGIVAIYDRGTENGRYYLVLEYVAGGDLHERVRNGGALPVDEATHLIRGVARGLQYAAQRGVIHRDIKPANILRTPEGDAKIADLGLAVQLDEEDERVTRDGTTVGTVDYMAPEQARDSRATSVRSDIYSLGCTFYQILAGVAPFAGGDVADKLRRHASEPPPDIRAIRPDVSPELASIIRRMLAKKPDKRYATYEDLIAALDSLPTGGGAPLDAIIEDDNPDAPLDAIIEDDDQPDAPLDAIIEDDDDEPNISGDFLPSGDLALGSTFEVKTVGQSATAPGRPSSDRKPAAAAAPPSRPEISLIELAKLDEDVVPIRKTTNRRPPGMTSSPPAGVSPMSAMLDEDSAYAVTGSVPTTRRYDADDDSLRTYILRGLLIGVAIVLLGFGLQQLILLQFSAETAAEPPSITSAEGTGELAAGNGPFVMP